MIATLRIIYRNLFLPPFQQNVIRFYCASNIELLRIIGKDGQSIGLMSHKDAENLATQQGLNLLKVIEKNNKIENSVYKLVDNVTGKSKNQSINSNIKTQQKTKELTLKSSIDVNDMKRKAKKLEEFLENGYHVTVRIAKPGRCKVLPRDAFNQLTSYLSCSYKIPNAPKESEKFFRCSLALQEDKSKK